MMIDASYSGQQVALSVGQTAELRLPENPTTGFRWSVVSDGDPACRLNDNGFHGGDGTPGRGGEHVWRLVGVSAGACELRLAYRRSFDAAGVNAGAFALHVQVK
jgi:inhibitor of cysteine peptidase